LCNKFLIYVKIPEFPANPRYSGLKLWVGNLNEYNNSGSKIGQIRENSALS
jgi:hypothetical protein